MPNPRLFTPSPKPFKPSTPNPQPQTLNRSPGSALGAGVQLRILMGGDREQDFIADAHCERMREAQVHTDSAQLQV